MGEGPYCVEDFAGFVIVDSRNGRIVVEVLLPDYSEARTIADAIAADMNARFRKGDLA